MKVVLENVGEGLEHWTLRLEGYGTVPDNDLFEEFNRLIWDHGMRLDLRPVNDRQFSQYPCCMHGMICVFESIFWDRDGMLAVGEAVAADLKAPFELV